MDLRTGARRTVRLPELHPGRRRLVELVPLADGAVAGVVADEWSPASTKPPPEPRVYAWPSSDLDRPGRLLGRASAVYPSPSPGRLWLSTARIRGGVTTFTVRELDAEADRPARRARWGRVTQRHCGADKIERKQVAFGRVAAVASSCLTSGT